MKTRNFFRKSFGFLKIFGNFAIKDDNHYPCQGPNINNP